jgi:hypothetical protein
MLLHKTQILMLLTVYSSFFVHHWKKSYELVAARCVSFKELRSTFLFSFLFVFL